MNQLQTLPRDMAGAGAAGVLATHKVLRNTYALLALTLAFSAGTAALSSAWKLPHPGILLTLAGYFGLLFATTKLRNSGWGVVSVFALTGFMGYTLGPIVGHYLSLANGHQVVLMAMGGTAAIFLGLSAYALTSKRDFGFLGGFLFAGILVAFLAGLGEDTNAVERLGLQGLQWHGVVDDLCQDLLSGACTGRECLIDAGTLAAWLDEVDDSRQRAPVIELCTQVIEADGEVHPGESLVLRAALEHWVMPMEDQARVEPLIYGLDFQVMPRQGLSAGA